jgi:hypothetical protein
MNPIFRNKLGMGRSYPKEAVVRSENMRENEHVPLQNRSFRIELPDRLPRRLTTPNQLLQKTTNQNQL